jgi:hypothetical protein
MSSNYRHLLVIVLFVFVFIPAALVIFPWLRPADGFANLDVAFVATAPRVFVSSNDVATMSPFSTCRSPNPAAGTVCPEGTFCEQISSNCVSNRIMADAEPVGYFS